jgi:hypothetical protein
MVPIRLLMRHQLLKDVTASSRALIFLGCNSNYLKAIERKRKFEKPQCSEPLLSPLSSSHRLYGRTTPVVLIPSPCFVRRCCPVQYSTAQHVLSGSLALSLQYSTVAPAFRHRSQPAKGTACRVRTIVDVPAFGEILTCCGAVQRYCIRSCSPSTTSTDGYVNLAKRWHQCPRVPRHPSRHSLRKPITPRSCPDLSRRRLCSTRPWVARTIRASSLSMSVDALCAGMRIIHYTMGVVLALLGDDLALCPRCLIRITFRSLMILRMYVTLLRVEMRMCKFFFNGGFIDVRRFRDEGDVAKAMAEGCGV